jgi:cobalt-precorrin-5B (C1)-methyltransferase
MAARGLFGTVEVEITVPKGEALSRHTLNGRLGIVGGISILGTTGIVRPLSHEAYEATIKAGLSVAHASGLRRVVLTTGRRSERFAQALWPLIPEEGFVQIGDYFAKALDMAVVTGFDEVVLAVFFGKAVKMAQRIPHTHAGAARMSLNTLARWAEEITENPRLAKRIAQANPAPQAFEMIKEDHPEIVARVGQEVVRAAMAFGRQAMNIGVVIFDFDGKVRFTERIDTSKG